MFALVREKINLILKTNKNKFNYECIRICVIYQVIGFIWVYFSDKVTNKIIGNRSILILVNTYKGLVYVLITSIILYLLINNFIKKIYLTKEQLKKSYEELEAYVQQLTEAEEELRIQYDQICENEKELSKSQEKSRAIIQAMPDLLFIINSEGVFIDCEASNEELLIMPKDAFIGKTISRNYA